MKLYRQLRVLFIKNIDRNIYFALTFFSVLVNFITISILSKKLNSEELADFLYFSAIFQVILVVADFGTRLSYFREHFIFRRKNAVNFILFRVLISFIIFLILCLFFWNKQMYFYFLPLIISSQFFPNIFLQEISKFVFIGINNVISKLFPLIIFIWIPDIHLYLILYTIVIIIDTMIIFKVFNISRGLNFNYFVFFSKRILLNNRFLAFSSLISIIEVYAHTFLSKILFTTSDFSVIASQERYSNFVKQIVIFFQDYIYVKSSNSKKSYKKKIIFIAFIYIIILLIITFVALFMNYDMFKYTTSSFNFFSVSLLVYPFIIVLFNFEQNIRFIRGGFDKYNLLIISTSSIIKILLMYYFYSFFGIFIVPIVLIFSEIFMGSIKSQIHKKYSNLYKEIKSNIQ